MAPLTLVITRENSINIQYDSHNSNDYLHTFIIKDDGDNDDDDDVDDDEDDNYDDGDGDDENDYFVFIVLLFQLFSYPTLFYKCLQLLICSIGVSVT